MPYCLLEARRWFKRQSRIEPADFGEHLARSTACEVLARRIMTKTPIERQYQVRLGLSRVCLRLRSVLAPSLTMSSVAYHERRRCLPLI